MGSELCHRAGVALHLWDCSPARFCVASLFMDRRSQIISLLLGAWIFLGSTVSSADVLPFSVSASGQFRVFSESRELRSTFCMRLDEFHERFEVYLTGRKPESGLRGGPIVVRLHLNPKGSASGRSALSKLRFAGPGLFHAQLDVGLGPDFSWDDVGRETVGLLLSLWVLDGMDVIPETELVPWWLKEGTWRGMESRQRLRNTEEFRAIVEAGKQLPVAALLGDGRPAGRPEVLRVSAEALVRALLVQRGGRTAFEKFMDNLPLGTRDAHGVLRRHWPELQKPREELEIWWALQARQLAEPGPFEVEGPAESEAALKNGLWLSTRVLVMQNAEKKRKTIGGLPVAPRRKPGKKLAPQDDIPLLHLTNFEAILKHPRRLEIATAGRERLGVIRSKSHPLYQPIAAGYGAILAELGDGKSKDIPQRLGELARRREEVLLLMSEVDAFMDWHEVTAGRKGQGSFEEYLRAAKAANQPPAPRSDALSRYLDAMDREIGDARATSPAR